MSGVRGYNIPSAEQTIMRVPEPTVAEARRAGLPQQKQHHEHLRWMFAATSALCAMMVVWILYFPGSWLIGRSKIHDDLVLPTLRGQMVSSETVTKYAGHTAVHLTHILPGAVWAGAIPFQIHPGIRSKYPRAHRIGGYAFLVAVCLMSVGIGIIIRRKLTFDHFFQDLDDTQTLVAPSMSLLTSWFLFTASYSVYLARSRRIADHRVWMVRHVASGIWIAIQRVMLTIAYPAVFWLFSAPVTRATQRKSFSDAATLAAVISICLGEYAVHLLRQESVRVKKSV